MASARVPHLSARLQGFGTTVFAEMTRLATEHKAVNLGQGFPDFDGPEFVKAAAIAAIRAGHNQYCRTSGIVELGRAIAEHQRRFYDLHFDPETEITVYSGATEAIFCTLQSLLDVGDEVILFEPFYDSYLASVAMAGASAKVITLKAPNFTWDVAALEAAVGPRTRAILLNTPNNPSGKMFSFTELQAIARVCIDRDLLAISDEVYEHITFDAEHVPLASLPGMRERTITISSSGKTFSFTGWKIGWTCAPAPLTAALRTAHQFVTFCNGTPFQHAIAAALLAPDGYYQELRTDYRARRDKVCDGLRRAGLEPLVPAGTYFVLADIRALDLGDDVEFCRSLPARVGVAAVPPSAFYVNKHEAKHLVRFAFCKSDAVLDEALSRLQRLRA